MQAVLADVETNYRHAEELMEQAMEGNPDILVLPETWNTGFYISRKLKSVADEGGKRTETFLSSFIKKHHVNVVGGSAAVLCGDDVYNRSFVFDREGRKIAEYDKVHGFPMLMSRCISKAVIMRFPLRWMTFPAPWSFVMISVSGTCPPFCPGRKADLFFVPTRLAEGASFPLDAFGTGKSGGEPDTYLCAVNQGGISGERVHGKLGASRSLGE